jgi:tryptophan-rich sensory protein
MSIVSLVVWLVLCFAAAAIGGLAVPGAWYRGLNKPSWNPPDWLFAPVWSILFIMMAVAAWLVWSRRSAADVALAIGLFALQLGLNPLWSWLFFGFHRPDLAFFEVMVFWLVILATTVAFWRISPLAGKLMLPYVAWVGFASFLNLVLWRMNPDAVGRS